MTVAERVIALIAARALADPAAITPGMTVESLGLDSLGLVEAVFTIEEAFDITVPFTPNEDGPGGFDVSTVGAIIRGVEGLIAAKAA
ncbi:acyl carrier protein [Pseudogemmobacter humi]|uniref:Acyl carrier protein n=1 Tax=Pseudogemmobacter humi TaxID=2483812 RepID=A0A3P5XYV8_9RHOB|nr:phosphopantetheine-binding protein [Pseudogemmobacter humi]VDC33364.1 Acyl carrier protein [Pseudogemmobacter humi]